MINTKEMRAEKMERLIETYRRWTDIKLLELQDTLKKHGTPLAKKAYEVIVKERNLKA